ncbi:MAG TPA: PilZ domain-containing protein [Sphingomicrobium sp.]|jgi:hypothetical protein|nr:PilZ domain-containing protein [Sphingomicrobium sp.]
MEEQMNPDLKPRSEHRSAVRLRAFVMRTKQQMADATVTDISYAGCRIKTDEKLKAGERRELRVARRGAAEVEIRWTDRKAGVAGARFVA